MSRLKNTYKKRKKKFGSNPLSQQLKNMNEIKKGDKVWYRWAHILDNSTDLRVEIVRDIITLSDGTKIVRHSEPSLFGLLPYPVDDTDYQEFLDNCAPYN